MRPWRRLKVLVDLIYALRAGYRRVGGGVQDFDAIKLLKFSVS